MPPRPELLREPTSVSSDDSVAASSKKRDDIDNLNCQVNAIMEKIADGSMASASNPMKGNPEAIAAVKAGKIVYQRRSKIFMAILVSGGGGGGAGESARRQVKPCENVVAVGRAARAHES